MLRRAIEAARQHGLEMSVGHELEFFLLRRTPEGGVSLYQPQPGTVYRLDRRVDPEGVIREMEDNVRDLGLPFVCVNQEYDPSHWEINTRFADALGAADDAHLLKLADQGDRGRARSRRDVHGQAGRRRRNLGLPPPLLGLGRRAQRLRRPRGRVRHLL